jgi:hypothetical protein
MSLALHCQTSILGQVNSVAVGAANATVIANMVGRVHIRGTPGAYSVNGVMTMTIGTNSYVVPVAIVCAAIPVPGVAYFQVVARIATAAAGFAVRNLVTNMNVA